jgi:hypothetical protein
MTDSFKNIAEKAKDRRAIPASFATLPGGGLAEMVHDPDQGTTRFAVWQEGQVRYENRVTVGEKLLRPYSPDNTLVQTEVVLFPSRADPYGSEPALVENLRAFIHRYVDPPFFETLAAYYVLFSWVYDSFNELPYLRVKGDAGSGKTRFLMTVGSLCYKPIFASGASTVSPLFRTLDLFRGTLGPSCVGRARSRYRPGRDGRGGCRRPLIVRFLRLCSELLLPRIVVRRGGFHAA